MISVLKLVFSTLPYPVIAVAIFVGMAVPLLIISEYIFLEPYVVAHLPQSTKFGFSLIIIISALSGLVLSMNIYRIRMLRRSDRKLGGGIFGSMMGAIAGACSCGPIGFAIISTFGSIGATTSAFLTNYEIPIRIAAIIVLCITYWTTTKSLGAECKIS